MDIEVETKRRSQNPKCKHDTEGEGGKTALNVPRTMTGRLSNPLKGVNNVTPWDGELTVGTTPANGAR